MSLLGVILRSVPNCTKASERKEWLDFLERGNVGKFERRLHGQVIVELHFVGYMFQVG